MKQFFIFLLLLVIRIVNSTPYREFNAGHENEVSLTDEDFREDSSVSRSSPEESDWPIYRPDLFEGDIANPGLDTSNVEQFGTFSLMSEKSDRLGLNALRNRLMLWPSTRIPYAISSLYTAPSRRVIAAAITEFEGKTCIRFVPKGRNDDDYLFIRPVDGCYSFVGRLGGRQTLSLGSGCFHKGIVMHELMHSVGFFHEQSRADRDQYIDVIWQNIMDGAKGQFKEYSLEVIDHL